MDVQAAIGIAGAPVLIAGVIGVIKPLLMRIPGFITEAIPVLALLLGIAYVFTAWAGGLLDLDNAFVAALMGLAVGIGAPGVRETVKTVRE